MASKMANTLSSCVTSPYLLQHAQNPVHWMPWGKQAHQLAKQLQKPIFLSIGYSSCHWCHVMERESFENEDVAKLLNDYFVNIKVDKEERPDVDRIYMNYVQATTGSGGWPLSVFLTPDLKPFVGGTYFPPEEKFGQTGFKTLIKRVHKIWHQDPATIKSKASHVFNMLKTTIAEQGNSTDAAQPISADALRGISMRIYRQLSTRFDRQYGGFSDAPKFPRPAEMQCLMALASSRILDPPESRHSLEMVLRTLTLMAQGGIHDHIGGGFSRYSVDELWHVPHFEKMLYDNAQLLQCYASAFRITRNPLYARIGCDIFDYISGEMMHPNGGFYSSLDADSRPTFDSTESREGAYYVLAHDEIMQQLPGLQGEIFCYHYNVKENGNCTMSSRSDPRGEFEGQNVLIELGEDPIQRTAQQFKRDEMEVRDLLQQCRRTLAKYRQATRLPPTLDDKIITAWNGMMISACAQAHLAFSIGSKGDCGTRDFLEAAVKSMDVVNRDLYVVEDDGKKRLLRSVRYVKQGPNQQEEGLHGPGAFTDDYAWMIAANLDLYEATADVKYVQDAIALQDVMDQKFKSGNSYLSGDPNDDPSVLVQIAEMNDGAEPSPNSVAMGNLFRLRSIVNDDLGQKYADMANAIWFWAQPTAEEIPNALPLMVGNSIIYTGGSDRKLEVVIVAAQHDSNVQAYLRELYSRYLPGLSLLCVTSKDAHDYLSKLNRTVREQSWPPDDRHATVYLCAGFTCQPPITESSVLIDKLDTITLKGTHYAAGDFGATCTA